MNKKVFAVSLIAASILLSGCASKQQGGTYIGAGVGAVACNMLTKNSPGAVQLLATAGCGALGGYLGNQIGKHLDERDRAELAATAQRAVSSSRAGTTNWKSSSSGATAKITVSDSYTKTESSKVRRSVDIQPVGKIEKLNAQYLSLKSANVRSAPSTRGEKLGLLPAMTEFTAMGKTGDWILVGRKGVVIGYVYSDLVQSKALYEKKLAEAQSKGMRDSAAKVATVEVVPAVKLDEATVEVEPELNKLVAPVASVSSNVESSTTCRTVSSVVRSKDGKTESSSSDACKSVELDRWADA